MWIYFDCGICGKNLDSWNESHDSVEFLFDISKLNCYKCNNNKLIKISCHRG